MFERLTTSLAIERSSEHKRLMGFRLFLNMCYFSERSLAVLVADKRQQSISERSPSPQEVVFTLPGRNSSHSSSVPCPGTDTNTKLRVCFYTFLCKTQRMCLYLDGIELVDTWSEVIRISPEGYSKQRQEAVHPCQQTLRSVQTERGGGIVMTTAIR